MLDSFIRPLIDAPLSSCARKIIDAGVSANQVTFLGFVIGLAGVLAVGFGAHLVGMVLLLINRLLDGLDGVVARATQETEFGRYFDNASNLIVTSAFVFFFAMSHMDQALGSAFLLFALFTLHASTVLSVDNSAKPFYALTMLAGRGEMIVFIVLACLYPPAFSAIAVLYGTLCFVTAIARLFEATRVLR